MSSHPQHPVPIAIVGMGCRYPAGANSPEELWNVVAEGRSGWTEVPLDRFNHKAFYHPDPEIPGAINQQGGHFIDQDIAAFDAGFFGIAQKEAETLDPQQRVVLEVSWEAVENAGIPMHQFKGSDTGIFVAMFGHDFEQMIHKDPASISKYHNLGVARPLLANRLSYVFDLQGPSVMLDTACSGSLAAVSSACQSLRSGESSMALAGGVNLIFSPDQMALMSMTGLFNDQGRSYTFDDRGNGYGRGEGVAVVALKRLDDALRDGDNIRAVIQSSGINSDGRTNGIMLPNQTAQERLARNLFRNLSFTPADVQYAEAHGTGTKAGDDVEMKTIRNVFCQGRGSENPIYVGATKPNIGHSEAASGVAGLIKAVMAMEKGFIPPNILLEKFKPGLEPDQRIMKVARTLTPWPSTISSRKAVVNSFGFGGTNAMVVLESEYTSSGVNGNAVERINGNVNGEEKRVPHLFSISARSEYSLKHAADDLRAYMERRNCVQLKDLSYTLTTRRSNFQWRSSVVAEDADSLIHALTEKKLPRNKISNQISNVFVFTGQGAQSARMGFQLLSAEENEFTRSIFRSEQLLKDLGAEWSLIEEISLDENSSRLNDSKYGQPASTAVQLALVDLLKSWNIRPAAVIGHSSGEIAAAYAAGAISQSAAMRISYHRGFLAEKSRQRTTQPGAMMAVGIGQEAAESYIDKLDSRGATVACVNSPSSTTISGDAAAISELMNSILADGLFARQLKVDTAYHSHHMKVVSSDYSDQLDGLEAGSVDPSIRYFSTVTGKEKSTGFGSSYWVENLVSPVQFLAALQNLCQESSLTSPNLIEIGPHKALSGPVRQTLARLEADDLSYRYIPTLVRGENSVKSLMEMGSSLFGSGSDLDMGAVASLSISRTSLPTLLRDLPPYHWDHTTTYWTESRLSSEYRCRKHPPHDLLGSRVVTSPDSQPSWRMLLSIETLPWLKDHVVDNFIVFPAAGYMTMAIQAVQQLEQDRRLDFKPSGYRLKNVSFKKTLTLPKDYSSVETVITFQYSDSNESWIFTVSSMSDQGKWQDHCDGTISAVLEMDHTEIEQGREAEFSGKFQATHLENAREACTKIISHDDLYAQMAATGNKYGPTFAVNKEVRMSGFQSLNSLVVPDISAKMPGRFMQPHVIHPTMLDAIIQTCLPLFQQYSVKGSVMPILMGDMFVSTDLMNQTGTQLEAVCDLSDVFAHSTSMSAAVFQPNDSGDPRCVLTMNGGEIRVVGESQTSFQKAENENIFRLEWGLDNSSVTAETLESVVIPLQSDEAGISQAEKVDSCSVACAKYIYWAVKEMHDRGLTVKDDHRANWWRLLDDFYHSQAGQALIRRGPETKDELDQLTSKLGVEGEAIARIGPELVPLLTGQTDPLTHFLQDELLFRVYHSDEGARPNRYMADYAKMLTFQRRDLRILEIGAGTGGTSFQVFQACSPNGEDFCSEYMYTDISSGFFEAVRSTKLKDWAHLLTFQTLDLEKDAAEQGFEEHSYDLVIAANVVHATRSLTKSLGTIRKLLKPGGILGLVELTKTTPYINMTFGSIPGWWAGVDEGRTDSPLQSAEQWNEHLQKTGFSGVDLAAYDLPEPERHCALLLSTALEVIPAINGRDTPRVEILNSIPEGIPAHVFSGQLVDELAKKGFEPSLADWTSAAVDNSSSYIILDSAERPLLTQASGEQFTRVTSLLSQASKVYWIVFADGSNGIVPDNALITGLSRTARNENPHLDCFTIDVQDPLDQHSDRVRHAITEFISSTEAKIARQQPREYELMYRDGKMLIQRFIQNDKLLKAVSTRSEESETGETIFHQVERPLKIKVNKPGLLSSLVFVDDDCGGLSPDHVEIKSYAWGLNFADVFIALGQLPPTQPMVGESAGIVTAVGSNFTSQYKPGDRVTALFGTPYASRTRTNGHLIHRIPDSLSFTDAASIPLTFATAYYSLFDCANLQQGQTILIHSASGALGQVAIKISQRVGVTVFATVGNASKRQLLMEQYGIPASHIFSSRTIDFAAGVKRLTNGTGVDVVLNSLSGPMLHSSWECVAPFGIFVEVGKTDIFRRNQLNMKPFEKNLRFASVDLVLLSRQRPAYCQKLLERIFADFESKLFTPLSVTTMSIGDIEKAFRLMQSRKHTGKIVLEANDESIVHAKIRLLRLRPDGTYVIVGGLGGLGKHLCRHLQAKGARNIALFSRKKFHSSVKSDTEKELTDYPEAVIRIFTCDVGDAEMVLRAAYELHHTMPLVKGVFHGGMVLSDRTVSHITQKDFEIVLKPKHQGTINIYNAFYNKDIDFFINLSSLCGIAGTLGQSNYAAGGTYQDMFTHAQLSAGHCKLVTLDFPLIKSTYTVSREYTNSLARQGVQLLPIEAALPVIDYVISGNAFKDGNHQIAFGLDPQSFIDQANNGKRVPPLVSHITSNRGRGLASHADQEKEQTVEERIALASTIEDAEKITLVAIREKISSLTALDSQELDVDQPVANMALDSLVSTEIKNWITNTLQASVQISDIMDAPSLRSLTSLVIGSSSLVKAKSEPKEESNGIEVNGGTNGDVQQTSSSGEANLPKYDLQSTKTTFDVFLDSVGHIGNAEELQRTHNAIDAFQDSNGVGQQLQERLAKISGEQGENDEVVDMYVRNKWLRGRDWRPRLRNFFATLPGQDTARQPQANQAAQLTLSAYEYKQAITAGAVKQDYYNNQALDMATIHWLFSSNRRPVLDCDQYERFPESDYLVAMKNGHAYKIPLKDHNRQVVTYEKLKSIFQMIIEQSPGGTNWASVFTTANRDDWAKVREDIMASTKSNHDFVKTIEESLFIVNLEDGEPETPKERADVFLLDENSNRWLDKTLSFIVCANGVSAIWGEHTMVDGTTFGGLIEALTTSTIDATKTLNGSSTPYAVVADSDFTYLPFITPPTLTKYITTLQDQHQSAHDGYTLANLTQTSYAAAYLREHKLPPKTVIQLVIQIAVRRILGYNPLGAVDVISQRSFRGGRTDMIYVMTPPVQAFCAAVEDSSVSSTQKRKLFLDAVKSHARLVTLSARGRGFRWHLMALREMLAPGEELPDFYKDEIFLRTSDRPVCTSFTEFGLPEMGRCQPHKEDVWVGVQVFDERVQYTVINGEGKSDEFVEHLQKAAEVMREIIMTA